MKISVYIFAIFTLLLLPSPLTHAGTFTQSRTLPEISDEPLFPREVIKKEIEKRVVENGQEKAIEEDAQKKPATLRQKLMYWVGHIPWEAVAVFLTLGLAIGGYLFSKRKKKGVARYFNDIDNTYSNFKMKGRRCEAELYRLKDIITEDFKQGKMDEHSFQMLDKRIDDYLREVREQIVNEKFGGIPANLKQELSVMLGSGDITQAEFEKFGALIDRSTLGEGDKKALEELVEGWKKEDTKR